MPSFNPNLVYKRCQLKNLRKDIRLLEIEEEDTQNKDKITIRLRVFEQAPEYAALSWCWGKPDGKEYDIYIKIGDNEDT